MSRCARPQAGHCARMQLLQGISELLPVVLQLLQLLLGSRRGHAILLLLLLLRRLCCYGWGQQRGSGGGGSAGCGSVGGRGLRGDGREGCELRGCGGSRCDGSGCLWELAHVDGGKVGHQERIVHLSKQHRRKDRPERKQKESRLEVRGQMRILEMAGNATGSRGAGAGAGARAGAEGQGQMAGTKKNSP
eukprot:262267-Pelagomonas_calceolata.AAC.3